MRRQRAEAFVLFYHRVHGTRDPFFPGLAPELFEWQMGFIADRFMVVPLESLPERIAAGSDRPLLVLTFDDGYSDVYHHAYPALRRHGLPATVFLVGSCLTDGAYLWPDKVSYLFKSTAATAVRLGPPLPLTLALDTVQARLDAADRVRAILKRVPDEVRCATVEALQHALDVHDFDGLRGSMLTVDQIAEMGRHELTFGSHSLTHPILTRIPLSKAWTEIADSKKVLERILGTPVTTFCYPNGLADDFNDDVVQFVRDSGYRVACTSIFGGNSASADPLALRRIPFTRRLLGGWPARMLGQLRHRLWNGHAV